MKQHTAITTLVTNNRTFKIIFDQDAYLAIEDKYINADGSINSVLNGAQMNAGRTLAECIDLTKKACLRDEYINQGFDRFAAVSLASGETMERAMEVSRRAKEFGLIH